MSKPQNELNRIVKMMEARALSIKPIDTSTEWTTMEGLRTALDSTRPTEWLATLYDPRCGVVALYESSGEETVCLTFLRNDEIENQAVKIFCLVWDQLEEGPTRAALGKTRAPNTLIALMAQGGLHWANTTTSLAPLFQ